MSLSARLYFQVELRASDPQPIGFQPAELRDHLLRQPVTQVFLVRVAGEVVEGKDGERQPPAWLGARPRTCAHPIGDEGRGAEHGRDRDEKRDERKSAGAPRGDGRSEATAASAEWASCAVGSAATRGDEPVTTARKGFDVTRGLGGVAQGLPQLPHRRVEAVVEIDVACPPATASPAPSLWSPRRPRGPVAGPTAEKAGPAA